MTNTTNFPRNSGEKTLQVFDVIALKRSGHHAVINWIIGCFAASGLEAVSINHASRDKLERRPHYVDESVAEALGKAALIMNQEDTYFWLRDRNQLHNAFRGLGNSIQEVIVLRDWYNAVASRMQKLNRAKFENFQTHVSETSGLSLSMMWQEQALIASDPWPAGMPMVFLYNEWFRNEQYREQIADMLGLPIADDSILDTVASYSVGSSFDNMKFDGRARVMNVMSRWLDLDPVMAREYQRYIIEQDPAIDGLNRELFGFGQFEVFMDMHNAGLLPQMPRAKIYD